MKKGKRKPRALLETLSAIPLSGSWKPFCVTGPFPSVISKPCKYWLPEKTKKGPYRAVLGKRILFSDRTGWHIKIRRSRTFLVFCCIYPINCSRQWRRVVVYNGHWATFVQNLKTKTNQTWFKKHNPCIPSYARALIFTIIIQCHVRTFALMNLKGKHRCWETLGRRKFER